MSNADDRGVALERARVLTLIEQTISHWNELGDRSYGNPRRRTNKVEIERRRARVDALRQLRQAVREGWDGIAFG